jgi:hypothetical protein
LWGIMPLTVSINAQSNILQTDSAELQSTDGRSVRKSGIPSSLISN